MVAYCECFYPAARNLYSFALMTGKSDINFSCSSFVHPINPNVHVVAEHVHVGVYMTVNPYLLHMSGFDKITLLKIFQVKVLSWLMVQYMWFLR